MTSTVPLNQTFPQFSPYYKSSKDAYAWLTRIMSMLTILVVNIVSLLNRFTQYLSNGGLGDISSNAVLLIAICPKLFAVLRTKEVGM
jgi:hypothetical protein